MASAFVINLLFHLKHVYIFRSSTQGGTHGTVKITYEVVCWELQNRLHTVLGDWDKRCLKFTIVYQLHYIHSYYISFLDRSTYNATAVVQMIEGRIFADPGMLYERAYIVHKSLSEAPMSSLRQSIAQSYVLPHCCILFFCWVFLKMCMTSFHASFKLWDFRQEDPYSYPVHTHTQRRDRGVQGLLPTWVGAP